MQMIFKQEPKKKTGSLTENSIFDLRKDSLLSYLTKWQVRTNS